MLDIHALMQGLAEKRPVFHSEADFQFALAWHIRERTNEPVRLEWMITETQPPTGRTKSGRRKRRRYLDLWLPKAGVAVELKYKTRRFDYKTDSANVDLPEESFSLREQGAEDHGRYDFLKDVARLEYLVDRRIAQCGIAILLTNDWLYRDRKSPDAIDVDFSLHDGRCFPREPTTMQWAENAAKRTTAGRNAPIVLNGEYALKWHPYRQLDERARGRFQYLAVEVTRDSARAALRGAMVRPVATRVSRSGCTILTMATKYRRLYKRLVLLSANECEWRTTFSEVESILGYSLPSSARTHRQWWENDRSRHRPQAKAWMDAGWETRNVSMSAETVEFHRVRATVP